VGEQPFLAAGFIFLVVMTVALIRLGKGAGGRHWALAWFVVWVAGGAAALRDTAPGMTAALSGLGVVFAGLFVTGTLRFLDRPVPRWVWGTIAGALVLRLATLPFLNPTAVEAAGGLLIWVATLTSSALLLSQRRADGTRQNRLLAATFPSVAAASTIYGWGILSGAPPWIGIFVWLMSGVALSGMQVIALVRRIADRAETERAVLTSLIESVPVGLALFDHGGAMRASNQAFHKIVRQPGVPVLDREAQALDALIDQLEPSDAETLQQPLEAPGQPDHELRLRNGLRIGVAVHTVTATQGQVVGRLWLLRDVTEERRLQESLERARRLETLGGFAGGVAHDFNNQLTSVLGNADLARETLAEGHPAHEILDDLASSAEYCARLTRDVLDFARRGPGHPKALDLAQLLPSILDHCEGTPVVLTVEPNAVHVRADPVQFERVVVNLVDNTHHAAGPAGRVELRTRRDAPAGQIAIEISDDGHGIDEATRARVFDPFYTTKPVGEGSGLGLAIVYGIVTGHGGEVRVECPAPGGTRLVTTWPADDETAGSVH